MKKITVEVRTIKSWGTIHTKHKGRVYDMFMTDQLAFEINMGATNFYVSALAQGLMVKLQRQKSILDWMNHTSQRVTAIKLWILCMLKLLLTITFEGLWLLKLAKLKYPFRVGDWIIKEKLCIVLERCSIVNISIKQYIWRINKLDDATE